MPVKSVYVFHHEHYHNALKSQLHSKYIPHYNKQRGGGIGGVIGSVSHYVIPIFKSYVMPEVKNAAVKTLEDVLQGTSIPNALLANTKSLIENVVKNIIQPNAQQGGSISRKAKRTSYKPLETTTKRKLKKPKKKKTVKKKCASKCKSKRDIFG